MDSKEIWYSQAGQDKWVCEFFNYKKNGYFLDIGAYNGTLDSNTYYLEKNLNWNGICIECGEDFDACKKNRSSLCLDVAVYSEECYLNFSPERHQATKNFMLNSIIVKAFTFKQIFEKYNVPTLIDYVSLDIEGLEFEALKGWPWNTHKSILWTIEHNLYVQNDPTLKNSIYEILSKNRYIRVIENVACQGSHGQPFEDWYVYKDYVNEKNNKLFSMGE
jgi:FkbM family methyltransferase